MTKRSHGLVLLLALILIASTIAPGQIKPSEDVNLNLSGNLGFGYSGTYGDLASSHGFSGSGNADMAGSYYSPQFLSFHISPYLNQSRDNSNFDSVTTTSGLRSSASIFSGSHFPGWVNYSRTWDGSSSYNLPGLADFSTHGNSNSFGVGWSETMPNWPSVSFGYQQGSSDFESFGAKLDSLVHTRVFNLQGAYRIDGFNLNAGFRDGTNDSRLPTSFVDGIRLKTDTNDTGYYFGASHGLPLHGSAQAQFSSTSFDSISQVSNNSGTIKTVTGTMTMNPTSKLALDGNILYTDNLVGTLFEQFLGAGGVSQTTLPGSSSDSWLVGGDAVYSLTPQMRVVGRADHRQQSLGSNSLSSDSFGGVFSYFRSFLGGRLSLVQSVNGNTLPNNNASQSNNQLQLGLSSSASYARSVAAWNLSAMFIFNQNQSTSLIGYTTDSYSYSGTAGRSIRSLYWSGTVSGSRSSAGGGPGSDITTQSYATSLSTRRIGISGSYSKSNGSAIQTATGLVPSPIPTPVVPTTLVGFGGNSFSVGAGGSPFRGLTFTGTFVKTSSDTLNSGVPSRDNQQLANFYMNYQFRKVNMHAGCSHTLQGFSATGTRDLAVNSYYFGISRWFNFF